MDVFAPYWFDPPPNAGSTTEVTVPSAVAPIAAIPRALMRERMGADLGARYELDGQVGEGGMATVWKARDRVTGEWVAVKALNSAHAQPGRFYREVSVQFRLRHPRVVPILNLLERGQRRYLILEYCGGGTLRDVLKRRKRDAALLPPSRVAAIAKDLAEALAAAHALGLAHRDLKPANVLFEEGPSHDGTDWQPARVADFGLARLAHRYGPSRSVGPRSASGSPSYMAPEQFTGAFCRASDLYALGVVCHEMLTGDVPARGAFDALAKLHRRRGVRVPQGLPAPWNDLLPRLLHRDPRRRPSDARDVAEALTRFCSVHPLEAAPSISSLLREGNAPSDALRELTPEHATKTFAATVVDGATASRPAATRLITKRSLGLRPSSVLPHIVTHKSRRFVIVAPEGVFLLPISVDDGLGRFIPGPESCIRSAAVSRHGPIVIEAGGRLHHLDADRAWIKGRVIGDSKGIAASAERALVAAGSNVLTVMSEDDRPPQTVVQAGPGSVVASADFVGRRHIVAHTAPAGRSSGDHRFVVHDCESGTDRWMNVADILAPIVGLRSRAAWVSLVRKGRDSVVTLSDANTLQSIELPGSADVSALAVDPETDRIHAVGSDGVLLTWSPTGELLQRRSIHLGGSTARALAVVASHAAVLFDDPEACRLEIHEVLPADRLRTGLDEEDR